MADGRFYVYALKDSRDGSTFYVGKGSGRRIRDHEAEAAKGAYSRKCERIRVIWADGGQVIRSIVSRHSDENEALTAEADLIDRIGLANLTNVFPGGIMGAEAYLTRRAEVEQCQREEAAAAFMRKFDEMAPTFARMFRAMRETGGFGAYIGDQWLECGADMERLFWDVVKTIGFEQAQTVMRTHGVELMRRGHAGAH